MSHIAQIGRVLLSCISLGASLGDAAASKCMSPDDFQLKIKNTSPEQIDSIEIPALEQFGISQLRLSPRATFDLCLSKPPSKCQTIVQVMYLDFPPITYERNICKDPTIILKKE